MEFPKTLIEFQERFPDEASCWTYVRGQRWPQGFTCPRCGSGGSHFVQSRRLEQCRQCRYQASVTAGTALHGTRMPLRVWLLAMFFLGRHKKGIAALQFQKDAGLGSYQTAWTLCGVHCGVPCGGPCGVPCGGPYGGQYGFPLGVPCGGPCGGPYGGPCGVPQRLVSCHEVIQHNIRCIP